MAQPALSQRAQIPIEKLQVTACKIPTDAPESDGTFEWNATTIVIVEVSGAGTMGLGYTYADTSTALLIRDLLTHLVVGRDAMDVPGAWAAMVHSIRNLGRPGIASMAIAAVDIALWDLKAHALQLPLVSLLGKLRDSVPAYGSGGFTSYSLQRLQQQLGKWAGAGMRFVKMKIGRDPSQDVERVRAAREAIGGNTRLFVDANGAYERKQASSFAHKFREFGVTWFEEPVSSDDLGGLRAIRENAPPEVEIAAGEYGYDTVYFQRMLDAEAVDVLQADATRCAGITGFLEAASVSEAHSVPLSAHTAPTIHSNICCSVQTCVRHIEYFHDHERVEHLLFDGAARPSNGDLYPNISEPGMGVVFKRADANRYQV